MKLHDGTYALRPASDKETIWRDDGERVVLENPETKLKRKSTGVKYTHSYTKDGRIILKDPDGTVLEDEHGQTIYFDAWEDVTGAAGEFDEWRR